MPIEACPVFVGLASQRLKSSYEASTSRDKGTETKSSCRRRSLDCKASTTWKMNTTLSRTPNKSKFKGASRTRTPPPASQAVQKWSESKSDESWTLYTSEDFVTDTSDFSDLSDLSDLSDSSDVSAGVKEIRQKEVNAELSAEPQLWEDSWIEHDVDTDCHRGASAGVPVYIMLPLDSVTMSNSVSRPRAMKASLAALKSAGVEGVMMDVWWGIVEREGPGRYDWSAYEELVILIKESGLKVQAVMSFHQCGGNVGDHCLIPLPPWVHEAIDQDNDIVYTDKSGRRNREYLSLSVDNLPVLHGRTPIQAYSDFMRSFREHFREHLGTVVTEIQVGMGPAGELRYPSYPEGNNLWRFPGIGEFQCYDKYMLAHLAAAAEAHGKPNWGYGGPHDSGCYKQWPQETGFFHEKGNWGSAYGQFFLQWYSDMLLLHGHRVLSAAAAIFRECSIQISGKVAGIHWHYGTQSHPAELTAGYYNTINRDGYVPIAKMFGRHGAILNFTCIEMKDSEQPWYALCSPEGLLRQVAHAAKVAGIRVSGENALPRYDPEAFGQIVRKSRLQLEGTSADDPMSSFTFLRMSEHLFRPENWRHFVLFVKHMREGRGYVPEHHCGHARDWVQAQLRATGSLSKVAAELLLQ